MSVIYYNIKQLAISKNGKKTPYVVLSTDILQFVLASMLCVVVLTCGMIENAGITPKSYNFDSQDSFTKLPQNLLLKC